MNKNGVERKKRRGSQFGKWITGFIILVIVLTFFSRTLYNLNLPTVTLSNAKQGNISHDISGSSYISYHDTWNIYPKVSGRIENIAVSAGDLVSEGQVLMTVMTEAGEEADITAEKDGIILVIGIQEGMYVMSSQNTVVCRMASANGKWETEITISQDQFNELEAGAAATIRVDTVSDGISGKIERTLSYSGADTEEKYTAVIVFESTEDLTGRQAAVTIPRQSDRFNAIIPSYALHKDTNGYYVYSVEEKNSVLGLQYIVCRVSVDILDSDDTSAAIMGVTEDMPIVEAATSELHSGMRVIYKESGA